MTPPLVSIQNLHKHYALPKKYLLQKAPVFKALQGIHLEIERGISFGIVGESGCGKSTLARIVMALDDPTKGTVVFDGRDLFKLSPPNLRHMRRHFQMVFQDPYGSLNPRKRILAIVAEPLETLAEKLPDAQKKERVSQMLVEVGLNATDKDKYPHEFSGGQRQRIAIARALITRPSLIVADESVSALDVSVQAQVLNLMMDLQERYALTYMFISHDLSVVEYVTDKLAVIYMGQIMEQAQTRALFQHPLHPYTQTLLRAVPSVDPLKRNPYESAVVSTYEVSAVSCPFIARCYKATRQCAEQAPELEAHGDHWVACFNVDLFG